MAKKTQDVAQPKAAGMPPRVLPAKAAEPAAAPAPKTNSKDSLPPAPPAKTATSPWRWPDLPPTAKIKILAEGNPRLAGSKAAAHWDKHVKDGRTVADFVKGGGEISRLKTDIARKSLRLEAAPGSGSA